MENRARTGIGLVADLEGFGVGVRRQYHFDHRQIVFAGKIQVALVVGRAAENGAGAVIHQDEVGDPDVERFTRLERMHHFQAGIEADLLGRIDIACDTPPLLSDLICVASCALPAAAAWASG